MARDAFPAWPHGDGEMAALIRAYDWAATPLGAIDTWAEPLRSTVNLLLAHGFPMVALWGPDLIQIYNDGYRVIMADKHPAGLGQPTAECWPEVWHINAPIYAKVLAGETVTFEDALYPIKRHGPLEDAWFTLTYSPLRGDGAAIAGVLVTVTETTDRVQESVRRDAAEAALHAREERFRAFVTASADVVYRMSPDWSQMWQLDGAGFLADTAEADEDWREKYILPADRERVEAAIQRAIGAKAVFELEHPVIRADSTPGWTSSRAVPILGADGEIVEWLGAAKDVTERKRAETALRESETLRRVAQAGGRMGSWRWDLGDRTVRGDAQFLALWGLPPSDDPVPLSAFIARQSEEGVAQTEGVVAKAIAAGEEFDAEVEVASGPTAGRWLRWRGRASPDDDAVLYGVSFDITAQRQAEAALRDSEDRLREVLNSMAEGFALFDPDFTIVDVNDATLALDGRTREELVGRSHWEAFPGSEDSPVGDLFKRVMRDRAPGSLEHVYVWPDGRRMWIDVRAYPNPAGRVACFWHDITKVKEAAEALRESEERQKFLLKLSDALRPIGDPVEIQGEVARLLGEHLEAGGCNYVEVDGDSGDWVIQRDYRRDGLPSIVGRFRRDEWPLLSEDFLRGELMSISDVEQYPLMSPDERAATEALGLVAMIIAPITKRGLFLGGMAVTDSKPRSWTPDDTALVVEVAERTWAGVERARAEAVMREAEALSRIALDSGRMGAWRWDLRSGLIRGDPVFLALYGLPPTEDLLSLPMFTERMSPESQAQISAVVAKAIEAGEEFEGDIQIVAGPTAGRWVRWRGRPAVGDTSVLHGVTYDITKQTQADIDLRESERQHAFLLALTDALRPLTDARQVVARATQMLGDYMQADRCFVAEMDPDGVNLDVHEEHLRPGASSVIGHHNFDSFGVFVSPVLARGDILAVEDIATLDLTEAERAHYAAVGIAAYLLVPLVRDGWFAACFAINHQTPHRWSKADKNIARQVADRTWAAVERARAQAALPESEERFRQFSEASSDVLWIIDAATTQLEYLSPAFERVWGVPRDVVTADLARWTEMLHPDDRARALTALPRALAGEPIMQEYRIIRGDGEIRYITDVGFPIFDDQGRIIRVGGIAQDLTERRRAEEALRESEERQRLMVELVPALLWSASPDGQDVTLNERWLVYTGQSQADTQDYGWLDAIHPDDLPATRAAFEHAFSSGEPIEHQHRIRKAGNGWRWHFVRHVPVRDRSGTITRWFGAAVDIHDSKVAEQALDESERRQRALIEGVPQLVWRGVDGGHWTWASPQWTDYTGQAEADSHEFGWLEPVHPDDRERVKAIWAGAIERGEFHADYRICHTAEHRYRWFQTRATPVRDENGAIVEWLGTSTDVDDLRALQSRQDVLLAELQHRVRNILAVTRSIISRSDDGERTTEDMSSTCRAGSPRWRGHRCC